MSSKEWPLMVFTLAMQLSAGIILIYDLFLLFPLYRTRVDLPARFQWILMIALAAAIVGVGCSFLHLGNPLNAPKTLSNLSGSWLSREVISLLIFTGLLLVVTILHFRFPSAGRSMKWLVDLTVLAGLVMIYCMSRIYMIPGRPAWNSLFTPAGFYLSSIILGTGILLLFQINSGSWASQKALSILAISVIAIQIALVPLYLSWIGIMERSSGLTLNVLLHDNLVWFYLRLVCYFLGLGCSIWALLSIRSDMVHNRYLFLPVILTLMAILAAQIIDRFLFYAQNLSAEGF